MKPTHNILLQDMQGVFEKLSEERVAIESDTSTVDSILTSTSSPPLVVDGSASTNAVVHSEVPRLLSW